MHLKFGKGPELPLHLHPNLPPAGRARRRPISGRWSEICHTASPARLERRSFATPSALSPGATHRACAMRGRCREPSAITTPTVTTPQGPPPIQLAQYIRYPILVPSPRASQLLSSPTPSVLLWPSSFFHGHEIAYAAQPETHLALIRLSYSQTTVLYPGHTPPDHHSYTCRRHNTSLAEHFLAWTIGSCLI